MKLDKRALVARTLCVGKERVRFNQERLHDIKEAITKQDIRDLVKDGAIFVREIDGRKKKKVMRARRRQGSIRRRINAGKKPYVHFVRGARAHLRQLKQTNVLAPHNIALLRKELRSRQIRTRASLQERIAQVKTG